MSETKGGGGGQPIVYWRFYHEVSLGLTLAKSPLNIRGTQNKKERGNMNRLVKATRSRCG
jgi:hypothetical protein